MAAVQQSALLVGGAAARQPPHCQHYFAYRQVVQDGPLLAVIVESVIGGERSERRLRFVALQVELKSKKETPDAGNLQKAADFVQAFILGARPRPHPGSSSTGVPQHVFCSAPAWMLCISGPSQTVAGRRSHASS